MSTEVAFSSPPPSKLRRWPRYKLDLPLRVLVDRDGKTVIIQGRGNELNEGGLSLFAGVELKPYDRIILEFTPPYTGQPIRARGVIRDRNGYNYGVEFLNDDAQDLSSPDEIRGVLRGYGVMVR